MGNPSAEVDIRILLRQILALATLFVGLEFAASTYLVYLPFV